MRLRLVLALALLAGCTAPPAPEGAPEPATFVVDDAPAALALAPMEAAPAAALDVSVALSERWMKPLRPLDVAVAAGEGARIAWFVELEEEEPRATVVDGDVFVLKSSTPDHHDTDGPRARIRLEDVASDGRARAMRLLTAGRYALDAEGARLVVNVWPDAPEGPAQAFLFEAEGRMRFEPAELDVAPGTRVLLWNQAGRSVDVQESAFAAFVPLPGRSSRLTPIDEGLYRLVALAVEGKARGIAQAAFLVDFERPSDRLHAGPYSGEFALAESGVEPARTYALRADHALASLVVRYEAGSLAPAPASVLVGLRDEHGTLAEASSLTAGEIELAELPAGAYTVEVRPEHGVRVGYTVEVEGRYRLPTPERLLERPT